MSRRRARRAGIVLAAILVLVAAALWLGGHWLWNQLLAMHGVR